MKQNIIIRVDGGVYTGMGHITRCIAIAEILKKKFNVIFAIQNPDKHIIQTIRPVTKAIIALPKTKNFNTDQVNFVRHLNNDDIVILDGYNFKTGYQKAIKNKGCKLVCIDDLHAWHHVADVIINHAEGINENKYSKEYYTKLCLGTPYAMLRRSFLKKALPKMPIDPQQGIKIFINLGGTDPENYTKKALELVVKNNQVKHIDVVIGNFYTYVTELKKFISQHQHIEIKLHINLSEKKICALMRHSEAGVCAASTISYEYATVGGILFVYQIAANQKNIYSFLIQSNSAFPASSFNKKISTFSNKQESENYFCKREEFFSGNSKNNLLAVFNELQTSTQIKMRKAQKKDLPVYFRWANDPGVRDNAVNTTAITLADHTRWFTSRLADKNSFLYLFEKNNKPIGQVRIDKKNNVGEIDYSVDSSMRGQGIGTLALIKALKEYKNKFPLDKVVAKARESNIASNQVFKKLGFQKLTPSAIKKIKYNNYILMPSAK